jgi:1-acyl-sn-glycerol-3-phosphate acyltransferase
MTKILNYIWRGWMIILGAVLTIVLGIPVLILSIRKEHYKYAYKFIRIWCFGMFYGMGFRYELIKLSKEKLKKSAICLYFKPHLDYGCNVAVSFNAESSTLLCRKKELVKIPIFGTIYKRICVMVDRKSAKSRADVYRRCAERMEEGQSIVIFPEGGVPDDTSIVLDNFKDGAFILSSKHNAPIAIFTFVGLKKMFPFDNSKGFPGKVKVYFNGILEPGKSANEEKAVAYNEIKKVLENSI